MLVVLEILENKLGIILILVASPEYPYTEPSLKIIKDGKLLPVENLKDIYGTLNLENKEIIFSCGSGITACVIALGAEVVGYNSKAIFDGSWTEWGDGNYPVEK